jgi:NADH:ubiquinone oxidoreductase subunit 4 (subunit M)
MIGVISTALTAGYYLWSIRRIFYGPSLQAEAGTKSDDETLKSWSEIHDPPKVITVPLSLLVFFVGLLGVFPAIGGWLAQTAAGDITTALTAIIAAGLIGMGV